LTAQDAVRASKDESTAEIDMDTAAFAPLAGDLGPLEKFLAQGASRRGGAVHIAQAGAFVPLRAAPRNMLLAQIVGRTRFKLVAAADAAKVYARDGMTSEIGDLEAPARSLAKFPLLAGARIYDYVLEPGEILFVPLAWWHQMRALDFGVVARFVNFRWPNDQDPESPAPRAGAAGRS
jgi:hypothetical protein